LQLSAKKRIFVAYLLQPGCNHFLINFEIMASVRAILFTHKKRKDGKSPIVIQIIKDRKRKIISTGYYADESEWNFTTNTPTKKHPNYELLKRLLKQKTVEAEQTMLSIETSEDVFTVDTVVERLKGVEYNKSVFDYWDNLIKILVSSKKSGNALAYKNTFGVFKRFRNDKDMTFKQLDYKCVNAFEKDLLARGLQLNGISFHMRTLRAMYNRAIKEGYANKELYPFEHYSIKKQKTQHRALTKDDIKQIRDTELKTEGADFARDLFMFSFYTRGMSFVDIAFLKPENINQGQLQYRRAKTGQTFTIKLTSEAMSIIMKYSDLKKVDKFVFPIIQNESKSHDDYRRMMRLTNRRLKKIGENLNLSIPLTTYVARHSWATVAKRSGVSTSVISEGMGHATEHITQVYLDSFENSVLDEANELITKLD